MPPKPPSLTPEGVGQIMREIASASQARRAVGQAAVKNPPRPGAGEINLNPGEEAGFFTILRAALEGMGAKPHPEASRILRTKRNLHDAKTISRGKSLQTPNMAFFRDDPARFETGNLPGGGFEPAPIQSIPGQGPAPAYYDKIYDMKPGEFIGPQGQSYETQPPQGKNLGTADLFRDPSVRGPAEEWVYDPYLKFANPIDKPRQKLLGPRDISSNPWVRLAGATGAGVEAMNEGQAQAASPEASNLARSATETDLLSRVLQNPAHRVGSQLLGYDPSTAAESADQTLQSAQEAPGKVSGHVLEALKQIGLGGSMAPGAWPMIQALFASMDPMIQAARTGQKTISEKVGGVSGATLGALPDILIQALLGSGIGKGLPKSTPGARAPGRGLVEGASPIPRGPTGRGGNIPSDFIPPGEARHMTGPGRVPGMPTNPGYMQGAHAREGPPTLSQYRNVNPEDFKYYPFKDTNQVAGRDVSIVSEWPYPGISTLRPKGSAAQAPNRMNLEPGSYDIPGIPVEEGGDPFLKELGGAYGNMSGAVYERLRPLFEKLYQGPAGPPKPLGP